MGFWLLVQSDKQGCSYIRNSIDKCLEQIREKVKTLDEEEYIKTRDSVQTKLALKDKNQAEDFSRASHEISNHRYQFGRQEKEIEMLKTITLDEFKAYFERLLFTDRRRLDMRWNSQKHSEEEEKSEFKLPDGEEVFFKSIPELQNAQG